MAVPCIVGGALLVLVGSWLIAPPALLVAVGLMLVAAGVDAIPSDDEP